MSRNARFLSTAFLAGVLAGGAAALAFAPHSDKSAHTSEQRSGATNDDELGTWSGQVAARQGAFKQALPPAPMGWY